MSFKERAEKLTAQRKAREAKPARPYESLSSSWRTEQADLRDYKTLPDRANFRNRIKKIALQPKGEADIYGIIGKVRGKP